MSTCRHVEIPTSLTLLTGMQQQISRQLTVTVLSWGPLKNAQVGREAKNVTLVKACSHSQFILLKHKKKVVIQNRKQTKRTWVKQYLAKPLLWSEHQISFGENYIMTDKNLKLCAKYDIFSKGFFLDSRGLYFTADWQEGGLWERAENMWQRSTDQGRGRGQGRGPWWLHPGLRPLVHGSDTLPQRHCPCQSVVFFKNKVKHL